MPHKTGVPSDWVSSRRSAPARRDCRGPGEGVGAVLCCWHVTTDSIGVWAGGGGAGGRSPPESGKIIFFGQSSNFSGSGQKIILKNILKIINEKYEKYYIG